ncbi:MAG TPA: VWA domain-containing protein [Terriglobales bacterium]|nr:VWA domain-containing protein [Terriglobales bacterium]
MNPRRSILIDRLAAALAPIALAASSLLLPGLLRAQQTPQTVITATAGEVLYDMVVTDKHGRVVKDLTPSEVEILDNGVPQKIKSFALVSRSVHLTAADLATIGAGSIAPSTLPGFNMVAIVFDHNMDASGTVLARQAAETWVKKDMGPRDYAAVYRFDQLSYPLQTFTTDKAALLRAINVATNGSSRQFRDLTQTANQLEQQATQLQQQAEASVGATGSGPGTAGPSTTAAATLAEAIMARMVAQSEAFAASGETTDASRSTMNDFLGIVHALARLPGRKAILYFTEWLPVNANTDFLFKDVINDANRANVSFYAIDTAGLNLATENGEIASNLNNAAGISRTEQNVGAVSMAQANESETTENVQYDSKHLMSDLAASTGGIFVANTNDLEGPMRELEADIDDHYELSWIPSSGLDDKFHTVEIRFTRPGLRVRARTGYFAGSAPAAGAVATAAPAAAFEAPMLELANSASPSTGGPVFRQSALVFPANPSLQTVEILMQVPLGDFAAAPAAGGKVAEHFSVLALIKNAQGQQVGKFSQDLPLTLPASALKQNFLFERTLQLAPGQYQLEGVLYEPGKKAGTVKQTPLTIGADSAALRLSSIAVVANVIKLDKAASAADNPLHYQSVRILPNLGEPLVKSPNARLTFYFVVYPPKGVTPTLTMTFLQSGQTLAQIPVQLPAPDPQGKIVLSPAFPLASFPAGDYTVVVKTEAGGETATQSANFTVSGQ